MNLSVLRSILNNVYAVDCELTEDALICGGLYLDPRIMTAVIRLANQEATLDVELPEELLNRPDPICSWAVTLNLHKT